MTLFPPPSTPTVSSLRPIIHTRQQKNWSHVCCSDGPIDSAEHLRVSLQSQSLTVDVSITTVASLLLQKWWFCHFGPGEKHLQELWVTQTCCRWCHIHRDAELAAVEVFVFVFLKTSRFYLFAGPTAGFSIACLAAKRELGVLIVGRCRNRVCKVWIPVSVMCFERCES